MPSGSKDDLLFAERLEGAGYLLALVILLMGLATPAPPCRAQSPIEKPGAFGKAAVTANSKDLSHTVVTAVLKEPIRPGTNVVWCATIQVAWDDFEKFLGKPVSMQNAPPSVAVLNEHLVKRSDLDPDSYVVFAGKDSEANREKIRRQIEAKFHGAGRARLLNDDGQSWFYLIYAYLLKALPFPSPFIRSALPFEFGGKRVASWNCMGSCFCMAREQIHVCDYRGPDDFVLTIRTKSENDILVMAKVPPGATLFETVRNVSGRITADGPQPTDSDFFVAPVLDFDLIRGYDELCNKPLFVGGRLQSDTIIGKAEQVVRFKLDESGALLESGVIGGVLGGEIALIEPKRLVFDKPFLVMLLRKGSRIPYFSLWVGNADLMAPMATESTGADSPFKTMNQEVDDTIKRLGQTPEQYRKSLEPRILPMGATKPLKPLKQVAPVYPPGALAAKIGGHVYVETVVNEKGDVESARILKSDNPVFNDSAVSAAKQWKFSCPVTNNGEVAKVFWIIRIDYKP